MSNDIPGLVETSSNLATASVEGDILRLHISNRSSVESALSGIQQRVIAIGRLAGASAEWVEGYPGWQPDMESPLLHLVQKVHEKTLGIPPEAKAVHAGLECGIIKQKYPSMDIVSFGPQIEFPHSPDERVKIYSVQGFFRLLVAVLEEIGRTSKDHER
jgi:dipeptidase D